MTSVKKLNNEYNEMKEPKDIFLFNFNPEDENHIRLCKFISKKLREFNLKNEYVLESYTTNERTSKVTGSNLIKQGETK